MPPNLPPSPQTPADHYATLVQRITAVAAIVQGITIIGESLDADRMRRSLALIKTAAI
jgi:hypothetical protein